MQLTQRFLRALTPRQKFELKVQKGASCWLWTGSRNNGGYGNFRFQGRLQKAHRVSYLLFCGEITANLNVLHKCDNPTCVNPSHLFLGTQKTNVLDMVKRGRHVGTRRLSAKEVLAIRAEKSYWGINVALGKKYNVTGYCIGQIRLGNRWAQCN